MTKSKSVGERLREIIQTVYAKSFLQGHTEVSKSPNETIDKAHKEILDLFRSLIPEKLDATTTSHEWCRGYSDACTELLKLLEDN